MNINFIEDYLIEIDFPYDTDFLKSCERYISQAYSIHKEETPELSKGHNYKLYDPTYNDDPDVYSTDHMTGVLGNLFNNKDHHEQWILFNRYLVDNFYESIHNIFEVDSPKIGDVSNNHLTNWAYISSGMAQYPIMHRHIHNGTSIAGVVYHNVPDKYGEFRYHQPELHNNGELKKVKVKEQKLYLFPGWMFHAPGYVESMTPRICFNMEYVSKMRPYLREKKIFW